MLHRQDTNSSSFADARPEQPDSLIAFVGQPIYIFLCIYSTNMALLGIVGNLFILVASCKYNAIKIDKITLVLMKHLAVADFLYSAIVTLSMSVTNICGGWCLGDAICHLVAIVKWFPATVEMFLILSITSYRVWSIKMALRLHIIKTRHANIVASIIWLLCATPILFPLIVGASSKPDIFMSTCNSDYRGLSVGKYILPAFVTIAFLIPLGLTIICNIGLLIFSILLSRSQPNASFKGSLITVTSLSFLFMISVLPFAVSMMTKTFHTKISHPLELEMIQAYSYTINTSCNTVLYTITNRRFRKFVVTFFKRCVCKNSVVTTLTGIDHSKSNNTSKVKYAY